MGGIASRTMRGAVAAAAVLLALARSGAGTPAQASIGSCGSEGTVECQGYAGYTTGAGGTSARQASMTAKWIEPRVVPHGYRDTYAAFFIGYADENGVGRGLEANMPQLGTEANSIGGVAHYDAWYSPGGQDSGGNAYRHRFLGSVRPGDHLAASDTVQFEATGAQRYTLKLSDVRYHHGKVVLRWSHTVRIPIDGDSPASVSVGVSRPNNQLLSDFGSVRFSKVTVNGAVIGSAEPDLSRVNWADAYGNVLAATSAFGRTGDNFSIAWKRGR